MSENVGCRQEATQQTLRIFGGAAEGPPPITLSSTFLDLWRRHVWPLRSSRRDPKTAADHQTSVDYFVAAVGNPRLGDIDHATLSAVLEFLEESTTARGRFGRAGAPRLSKRTVKKHVTNIEAILAEMGPPTKRHRTALGLRGLGHGGAMPMFPELNVPRLRAPKGFALSHLARMMECADSAGRPQSSRGPTAGQWWRAAIEVLYNTAIRRGTFLALRAEWIDAEGWLEPPASAYKRGELRVIYFNSHARAAIQRISGGRHCGLVFPWDGHVTHLSTCLRRIERAAGVEHRPGRAFHGFRRACATELARLSPSMAAFHLGHAAACGSQAGLEIVRQSYIDGRTPAEWLERLPQPTVGCAQREMF